MHSDVIELQHSSPLQSDSIAALPSHRAANRRNAWPLVGAVLVFLALGFGLFRSTGQDDSYISYWPAHTLAHYGRIVNYDGELVEQSSSLLWVLLLGLISFISRAPVPLIGPLASVASGALALVLAARLASRLDIKARAWALFFIASSTYLVYWSFSGMESSLAAVCTAWIAVACADYFAGVQRRRWEVASASLACILVRPEMGPVLFLALCLLGGALWLRRSNQLLESKVFTVILKRITFVLGIVGLMSIALALSRLAIFGSALPEPALVKGGKQPHVEEGLLYIFESLIRWYVVPAACLAFAGIVFAIKDCVAGPVVNLTRLTCALLLVAYGCFIVWVGGDWMLAGRFVVHVLPVMLVLAADTLARIARGRRLPVTASLILLIQLAGLFRCAYAIGVGVSPSRIHPEIDPQLLSRLGWFERADRLFLRDTQVVPVVEKVARTLEQSEHAKPRILSGQMGLVMFKLLSDEYGRVDVTDRHGLEDSRFRDCSESKERGRLTNGLAVDYQWYLPRRKLIEDECRIPAPDMIYDIEDVGNKSRVRAIYLNGYAIVYHRVCDEPQPSALLPGSPVALDEYVAVRRDLLPALGYRELMPDQFGDGTN